jgi:hypothetical protein
LPRYIPTIAELGNCDGLKDDDRSNRYQYYPVASGEKSSLLEPTKKRTKVPIELRHEL